MIIKKSGNKKVGNNSSASINPIASVDAPAAANSAGNAGAVAYDSSYIYVCIATDTWKRAAISTW